MMSAISRIKDLNQCISLLTPNYSTHKSLPIYNMPYPCNRKSTSTYPSSAEPSQPLDASTAQGPSHITSQDDAPPPTYASLGTSSSLSEKRIIDSFDGTINLTPSYQPPSKHNPLTTHALSAIVQQNTLKVSEKIKSTHGQAQV